MYDASGIWYVSHSCQVTILGKYANLGYRMVSVKLMTIVDMRTLIRIIQISNLFPLFIKKLKTSGGRGVSFLEYAQRMQLVFSN